MAFKRRAIFQPMQLWENLAVWQRSFASFISDYLVKNGSKINNSQFTEIDFREFTADLFFKITTKHFLGREEVVYVDGKDI